MKWSQTEINKMRKHKEQFGITQTAIDYEISKPRVYQLTGKAKTKNPVKITKPLATVANAKTVKKIIQPKEQSFVVLVLPANRLGDFVKAMQ